MNKLFAVLACLLVACGASTPATSQPEGCTPWTDGAPPDGCEVAFEHCCYRDAESACAAAGCPGNCVILESYPGQVRCN